MYTRVAGFVQSALFASLAFGQAPGAPGVDRVFDLTQTETPQQLQEIATTIRAVADMPKVFADIAQRRLTVHGTGDQIRLAEFLVNELNKPVPETPAARQMQNTTLHELRLPGERFDVARVFYFDYIRTPQELQEAVTLIRLISDMPYAFVSNKLEAMALRGNADQIAVAAWLVNELNKPPRDPTQATTSAATHEYDVPGSGHETVCVFHLLHPATSKHLQEIAVAVRSGANVRRVFINNAQQVVAARGTADQMAAAERSVREMDRAPVPR